MAATVDEPFIDAYLDSSSAEYIAFVEDYVSTLLRLLNEGLEGFTVISIRVLGLRLTLSMDPDRSA